MQRAYSSVFRVPFITDVDLAVFNRLVSRRPSQAWEQAFAEPCFSDVSGVKWSWKTMLLGVCA